MLLVKVPKITSRIRYTFSYMLTSLYGWQVDYTSDDAQYLAYEGPRLVYGGEAIAGELYFAASGLLFSRSIEGIEPGYDTVSQGLFPVFGQQSALSFDPFAGAFYMLSRYEEYLPFRKDSHGRFPASGSIASRYGFLQNSVVNAWAAGVAALLQQRFPALIPRQQPYRFIPTIDVDQAYAYKHKGALRTAAGYARDLFRFGFGAFKERTAVLTGKMPDPFDSYHHLHQLHTRYGLQAIYFFLFADYGPYDKNLPVHNPGFRQLIQEVSDNSPVGIHPSYASSLQPMLLKKETDALSQALNVEITRSRQHFLKLHLPQTYRNLIHNDILEDYTMGYADQPGFRAGVCTPFPFFDLDLDAPTSLMIYPFTLMDGTFKDYLNIDDNLVVEYARPLIAEVRKYNGTLITLWHNETQGGSGRWKAWPQIYEEILRLGSA